MYINKYIMYMYDMYDEAHAIQEERPMHQEALKKAEDAEALAIQIILRLC